MVRVFVAFMLLLLHSISSNAQCTFNCSKQDTHSNKLLEQLSHRDISEGLRLEPYTVASLKEGRVQIVDSTRDNTIKQVNLNISPGDCSQVWPAEKGSWNDCDNGNERIGINEEKLRKGKWWYTASLKLDKTSFTTKSETQSHVNLLQWLDQDTDNGPPFNLMWFWEKPNAWYFKDINWPKNSLAIDNRISDFGLKDPNDSNGGHTWSPLKIVASFEVDNSIMSNWLDFTAHANWTDKNNGWLIITLNGQIIYDYRGKTLEKNSNGVAFDVQLYRYGRRDSWQFGTPISGDTNMKMAVTRIGVFSDRKKLDRTREEFSHGADMIEKALKKLPEGSASHQPSLSDFGDRYHGCELSIFCNPMPSH